MNRRIVSGIMLTLFLTSTLIGAFNIQQVKAGIPTIIVPYDYLTIQEAINNADEGDRIFVLSGTYYENVIVNKTVSLVGENRTTTTIDGDHVGAVVNVTANNVKITGFTIQNSGIVYPSYGIYVGEVSSGNNISSNTIVKNQYGIFLHHSNANIVTCNNISGNREDGPVLYHSLNNGLYGNKIMANGDDGISIWYSSGNILSHNVMNGNRYNFDLLGYPGFILDYLQSIDTSNLVDGKPIYYLVNSHDAEVPLDAGCVALVNCTKMTVRNLTLKNNRDGLLLAFTQESYVTNNHIEYNSFGVNLINSPNNIISGNNLNNWHGIHLRHSYSNTIFGNNITAGEWGIWLDWTCENNTVSGNSIANSGRGLYLFGASSNVISGNSITNNSKGVSLYRSSNNRFYHNNFVDNPEHVQIETPGYTNFWDNGYPLGGNYWSNYTATDLHWGPSQNVSGSDGIGDTPYVIDVEDRDGYPLMNPYIPGNLSVSICTDNTTYHAGETMHLGLNVTNPDSVKYSCFAVWCELPDSSIYLYMHEHSVILPIGFTYANPIFKSFILPTLPSGNYTWRVAFLERATHTIIVEGTAEWIFS